MTHEAVLKSCGYRIAALGATLEFEFEFRQLRYFVIVCRMKSFTRAAEEIGVSQSSLSRSVLKLEEAIGQPLLERKPREVVTTDVGELFLARAEQILALAEDSFAEVSEAANHGRIRLAVIPTIAPYFLPTVLSKFSKQHPNVSIIVQEDTTENSIRMIRHGDIDVAILALPVSEKYLEVESLFEEELVLVLPNGHPLAKKKIVKVSDAKDYPFVMLDQAHCLSDNIESFCKMQSVQPVAIERTSQLATVQELVSLDHGISMVPKMAQVLDLSKRRVYRSFSGTKPTRTVAMLFNPYRFESRWLKLFKEHLRSTSS